MNAVAANGDATCVSTSTGVDCYGHAQGRVSLSSSVVHMELASFTSTNVVPTIYDNSLCGLTATGQIKCDTNVRSSYGLTLDAPRTGGHIDVAVAYARACALDAGGYAECWNMNDNAAPTMPMLDISGGAFNFCGIKASDGGLICWGDSNNGSLSFPPQTTGFFALDVGTSGTSTNEYGCALNMTGMSCWGSRPANVPQNTPGSFTQLSVGGDHVCAVKTSGELECWGSNTASQLDVPTN